MPKVSVMNPPWSKSAKVLACLGLYVLLAVCTAAVEAKKTANPLLGSARIVKIEAWSFGSAPGSTHSDEDLFSITINNPSPFPRVLLAIWGNDHGQRSKPPVITKASAGMRSKYKISDVVMWSVPLTSGQTKTIFFVARSFKSDQYCAGPNDQYLTKCT